MKHFVRLAVAGAIAAGYSVGAFAQLGPTTPSLPSSGTSDLWVYVTDPGAQDTFAVDTGISMSSLQPSSYTAGAKTLSTSTDAAANFSITSAALASFVASSSDPSALQIAALGAQYPVAGPSNTAATVPGADTAVFSTSTTTLAGLVSNIQFGNMKVIAPATNGDEYYMVYNSPNGYTQGGSVYNFSDGSVGGNVYGANTGSNGGSTNLYGQGPSQTGVAVGTAADLYDITGNNSTTSLQSYLLGTITVNSNGTITEMAPASTVPLPAGFWLLGSGMLGLFGVGRRRAA